MVLEISIVFKFIEGEISLSSLKYTLERWNHMKGILFIEEKYLGDTNKQWSR